MSKGPGKVERAIERILTDNLDEAFTTEELCKLIYGAADKKHRVAVIRAGNTLLRRDRRFNFYGLFGIGKQNAYFNTLSLMSYARQA